MGLFENVSIIQRVQLTHGAMLTQREVKARKQLFGIECFDLIASMSQKSRMNMFLHQVDVDGAESYMACEGDINRLETEKEVKIQKLNKVQGENTGGAGHWILVEKLQTEVSFLERKIRARKERFGLEFFDSIKVAKKRKGKDQAQLKVNKPKGYAFQSCIERAKYDVWLLRTRQQTREDEARLAEC